MPCLLSERIVNSVAKIVHLSKNTLLMENPDSKRREELAAVPGTATSLASG
jgi:hypothetical protein